MKVTLSEDVARRFARVALSHVTQAYPTKLDHVIRGPDDLLGPQQLHPVFYGSFDWHSCVHGYWLLATVYRRWPHMDVAEDIRQLFDLQFTESNVAGELTYLRQPMRASFERPYGWAWLLMLAAELSRHLDVSSRRWARALAPLSDAFTSRFLAFLPKATYPIRSGAHFNTAFALSLALEYADTVGDDGFAATLRGRALSWYAADADCQAWEPSGDDFLSPALMEAECMRRVLPVGEFVPWFARFLPRIGHREPRVLFVPATVSDRADGKIAHLDGLNLSRAWCWRSLAETWPDRDPLRQIALDAADVHVEHSLEHIAGDYMGEHWLATFALLALDAPRPAGPAT